MIGVGWCYEIICRLFPDGGGVYSSARHRSQLLAVVVGLNFFGPKKAGTVAMVVAPATVVGTLIIGGFPLNRPAAATSFVYAFSSGTAGQGASGLIITQAKTPTATSPTAAPASSAASSSPCVAPLRPTS